MSKLLRNLCVAIICMLAHTASAGEIYLFGSETGYVEPSESNQSTYASWVLSETSSGVYQNVFYLSSGDKYLRFYTSLSGWSGTCIGAQEADSPVSIEINGAYEGSFVYGSGMLNFEWGGGNLKITVDFNTNKITFDAENTTPDEEEIEDEFYTIDGVTYQRTSSDEATVYDVNCSGEVVIPDSVSFNNTTYSVTDIYYAAFQDCPEVTSVTLPSSMGTIKFANFDNCEALAALNIDESHSTYASKEGVIFNKDYTILLYCPKGKSGDYTVPDGVTSIGEEYESWGSTMFTTPFNGCKKLTSITIPASVKGMENLACNSFNSCEEMRAVEVSEANEVFASIDGVLFTKDLTKLLYYPRAKAGEIYEIPQTVTMINYYALSYAKFSSVTIPENVSTIGGNAFAGCTNIKEINFNARNCNIDITIGVGTISAWPESISAEINIGESVVYLGNNVFYGIILDEIVIPDNVATIAGNAFSNVKKAVIGSGTVSISPKSFGMNLEAYEVSPDNKSFTAENGVLFSKDKSTLIEYPAAKADAAYIIPSTVTTVQTNSFYGNTLLESIEIPTSVTTLGDWSFGYNPNIKKIVSLNPSATGCNSDYTFGSNDEYYVDEIFSNATLYVPVGASESYKNATGWKSFQNIVEGASSNVAVTKNIANAGEVSMPDVETFTIGEEITVSATAAGGYEFDCWAENGVEVSTDASYTFIIGLERTLEAKFSAVANENDVVVENNEPDTASITIEPEADATSYVVNIYSDEALTQLVATQNYDANGNVMTASGTGITLDFSGLELGTYFYEVIVKTTTGESDTAEETVASVYVGTFDITVSGIDNLTDGQIKCVATAEGLSISNANGQTASVYDLTGRLAAQTIVKENAVIYLQPGIYVVKIGQTVFKIRI